MTKARRVELIALYAGGSAGIHAELMDGGIDIVEPYTSGIEIKTGDLIFRQKEPKEEAGLGLPVRKDKDAPVTYSTQPKPDKKPAKKGKK